MQTIKNAIYMQVAIKVPIETVLLVAGDKETGEGKAC